MNEEKNELTQPTSRPIIVGLDIGTTKIVAIAGRRNDYDKIEILGHGFSNSSGVNHGMVLNIEECNKCIEAALLDCKTKNPFLEINEVYVGVAGHHIRSIQTQGKRVIQNEDDVVARKDVEMLIKEQFKTSIHPGDQIIDVIPQEFMVDSHGPFLRENVVGMSANNLRANFHIITADKDAIKNINRAVTRSSIAIKDFELQPLASAAAVMSAEDIEMGVAIIDIGGGTTDLAVFHDGIIKHTAVIPRAGVNITQDIKSGLGVLKSQAEQMKKKFGVALADEVSSNTFISIPSIRGHKPKEISAKNLAKIIQARMEEILDHVQHHLRQLNLEDKLHGGVILTGGGSQLKHLKQLTEFKLGLPARIGFPDQHIAGTEATKLNQPMFATCIGLILRGYDDVDNNRFTSFAANTLYEESVETVREAVVDNNDAVYDELATLFPVENDEIKVVTEKEDTVKPITEEPNVDDNNDHLAQDLVDFFTLGDPMPVEKVEPKKEDVPTEKRTNGLKKVFSTIGNNIMKIFDDEEDEKIK
jgi:cell division protein FtsA